MIGTFPSSLYYQLNIKCISEQDFYDYIDETIEKKRALVLSDSYFILYQEPVGGIKLVEKNDEKVAHIVDF